MRRVDYLSGGAGGPGVPVRNGLIAEYRMDDGSGTNLNDYTLNALDGTLPVAPATPTWATEGLSFDGGDYVYLPDGISTAFHGKNAVTIMAVVNRNTNNVTTNLLDITHIAGTSKIYFWFDNVNRLALRTRSVSTDLPANVTKTTTTTFTNTTRYLSITGVSRLSEGTIDIYINGVKEGATFSATFGQTTFAAANGNSPRLGSESGSADPFRGVVCWFVIYNRALSQSEINKNHAYFVSKLKKSRGITIT